QGPPRRHTLEPLLHRRDLELSKILQRASRTRAHAQLPRETAGRPRQSFRRAALQQSAIAGDLLYLRRRLLLPRNFCPGLPRFRQSDRDGLLPARHLLAGAATLERSLLSLVHRPLNFLSGRLTVLCHCAVSFHTAREASPSLPPAAAAGASKVFFPHD